MEGPSWLTSELVQNFLATVNKQVQSYRVESATKPGENFLSTVYRLIITTTTDEQISLIMKAETGKADIDHFITTVRAFPKETVFYQELLPEFEKLWLDYSKEAISFGPKCFYATTVPLQIIVLEDLRPDGFVLRSRRSGINIRETQMVLEKLAKFHACSVKRFEQIRPYNEELFISGLVRNELRDFLNDYYGPSFEQFLWTVERHVKDGGKYLSKLTQFRGQQFDILKSGMMFDEENFHVFAHGDLWLNNFLFNATDDASSTDVKFIDYQICQWTSPASDLLLLLFTSCGPETIVKELDNLIEFYHRELEKDMIILQCQRNPPSLGELKREVDRRGAIATIVVSEALAMGKADTGHGLDLSSWTLRTPEAAEMRMKIYSNPEYVEALNILLPYLEEKGYLELNIL